MKIIKTINLILAFGLLFSSVNAQEQKPELVVQTGFGIFVQSVAFSLDGRLIAADSYNFTAKLLNRKTGEELRVLRGHDSIINSIAFSPDNSLIATASADYTTKVWSVETGREVFTLRGHQKSVKSATFSPNGRMIASGSEDGAIKLWDAATGKEIRTIETHAYNVNSVAFSPDGLTIASGNLDRTVKLWSVETGKELQTFRGHTYNVVSVTFSPDGRIIASGSWDGTIKLWSVTTGQELKTFISNSKTVLSVAFSPDGQTIAAGNGDYSVMLWSVVTGERLQTFRGHSSIVTSVAFSPDGREIISAGNDHTVRLWNVITGEQLRTSGGHISNVFGAIAFSPDNRTIAVGTENGSIKLWSVGTGNELRTFRGHTEDIWGIAFSSDGQKIASGSMDGTIKLWSVKTGLVLKSFVSNSLSTQHKVSSVVPAFYKFYEPVSRDKRFRAKTQGNGKLDLHNFKTDKLICSLVVLDENDWAVITTDGYFDGTPNAWKLLSWRLSERLYDVVPIEAFFSEFFRPNLLADIFAGKTIEKTSRDLASIDIRQPTVKVELTSSNTNAAIIERQVNVTVTITDNPANERKPNSTSGAQDLRLFRNGSLVRIWHGDSFKLAKADGCEQVKPNNQIEPRQVRCQAEIPIVAGENNFTAYAFNSANVKSNDDTVSVKGADSLKRDGTLYVLAVGVNKYANPAYNLNFAVPDVEEIGAAIKQRQDKLAQDAKLKQYARTEIITLTDENATKENILLALRHFSEGDKAAVSNSISEKLKTELAKIKPTQPEDALIIYYAGHGTSNGQRFYLLPHNFTGANGVKSLDEQGVSDIELNEALEKVDVGRLLMAIDACQSGQALGAQNEGRGPMNSKGLAQLAYDKGMLILTAAQSQQSALEAVRIGNKEIKHGLLTYALLQGLTDSQADRDGNRQLWEREWLDYAVEQVPQLQLEAMKQRRLEIKKTGRGAEIVFVNGDNKNANPADRKVQTPRLFYRREAEINPMIIAKP